MKIFSHFKDYYDYMQVYGQDPNCVYHRKTQTWYLNKITNTYSREPQKNNKKTYIVSQACDCNILGFCGKIYNILHIDSNMFSGQDDIYNKSFCYSFDSYVKFIKNILGSTLYEYFNASWSEKKRMERQLLYKPSAYKDSKINFLRKQGLWYRDLLNFLNKEDIEHFFSMPTDEFMPLFKEFKVPVFLCPMYLPNRADKKWDRPKLIQLNPNLFNIGFEQVMTPPIAYTTLESYISGVLGNELRPIPEISNEDMIEAKGFDLKTSFRKDKNI